VLHGLLRVRGFTQDDAHIFCTPESIVDEVKNTVAFALRILRRETGSYPATLDEVLTKGLMPEVPIDLFDGRPLRYSAERRLLWSVYENGADDGGVEKIDLVVKLP